MLTTEAEFTSQRHPDTLFNLAGKVALVSGGARGIGLFATEGLVRSGVKVYVASRDAAACEMIAERLSRHGACVPLPCDLLGPDEVERLATEVMAREPKLDILVNNSGAFHTATLDEFPEQGWDTVLDLNLKAPFFLTQKLLPALRAAASADDPARVINISSIAAVRAYDNNGYPYQASKAGLNHLTRAMASRLAREHITVNAISPGPMAGGMMVRTTQDEEFRARIEGSIPLRRTGDADDMTGALRFLCSRAGAYLTGVVLPLDGGSSTCI